LAGWAPVVVAGGFPSQARRIFGSNLWVTQMDSLPPGSATQTGQGAGQATIGGVTESVEAVEPVGLPAIPLFESGLAPTFSLSGPDRPPSESYAPTRGAAEATPPSTPLLVKPRAPQNVAGSNKVDRHAIRRRLPNGRPRERRGAVCRHRGSRRVTAPSRAGPSDGSGSEPPGEPPLAGRSIHKAGVAA
jgi:hypothetical protein